MSSVQLKKVLDAVRELITDANFECSEDGIVSCTRNVAFDLAVYRFIALTFPFGTSALLCTITATASDG